MKTEKYLLNIEFRYSDAPKHENDSRHKTKTITIGVYDSFEKACVEGNNLMEIMESKYSTHVFPNGVKATKQRFSKKGGCFGSSKTLISEMAYLKTPFSFFAKITTLKHDDIEAVLNEIEISSKRYRDYKRSQESN